MTDADTVLEQRMYIDRFATAAGRDPSRIDAVMRVDTAESASPAEVAVTIKSLAEHTGNSTSWSKPCPCPTSTPRSNSSPR
ncbi:hypothetical protein ACBJ59_60395 [Nonomuraea sp. MTCD27]|uniref:hypothetical protein n=1 Tax=Nonomuraea sp. MTCD27 TaxID=1676747 RepID=UPI0035BF83CE